MDEAKALVNQQIKMLGETPETQFKCTRSPGRQGDRATADQIRGDPRKEPDGERATCSSAAPNCSIKDAGASANTRAGRLVDLLKQQGLPQRAALVLSSEAVAASNFNEIPAARQYAEAAASLTADDAQGRSVDFNANLAVAYAGMGDVPRARRYFANITPLDVPDAQLRGLITSSSRASSPSSRASRQRRLRGWRVSGSEQAFVADQRVLRSRPRERGPQALGRCRARLSRRARSTTGSAVQPRRSALRIGARPRAGGSGKNVEAREAYRTFLEHWSQADADLKELEAARIEAATLGT